MNKTLLTGRFTADPKVTYKGDTTIARGTIAVNRRKEGADFISVVAFGKTAEFIEKYFRKGMKADISGRIQTGSYDDKNGKKVYTTDVVIEDIEFGESKKSKAEVNEEPAEFETVTDDESLPFN